MGSLIFTVEVHHGGYFAINPTRYVNGVVNHVDDCDEDMWSKLEAEDIVRRLGYSKHKLLWYRVPNRSLDEGLMLIGTDKDAMDMCRVVRGHEQVEMYVEHVIEDVPDNIVESLPLPPPPVDTPMNEFETPPNDMFDVNIDNDNGGGVYYNTDSDESCINVEVPHSDGSDCEYDYEAEMFDKQKEDKGGHDDFEDELFGTDEKEKEQPGQGR
ncbi:hypothetical protein Vadar_019319 [Vaccinium darrowii]|uniref:Uncharacterized protein n=1 Tax=Vaccinium darrowii TaxID=229202 RepID=A0ACB7Z5B3_9ERIC|nr:hypothetical protein Vadar_019319 [Vaccinium darrowii]